jgi:hypothetical protein
MWHSESRCVIDQPWNRMCSVSPDAAAPTDISCEKPLSRLARVGPIGSASDTTRPRRARLAACALTSSVTKLTVPR